MLRILTWSSSGATRSSVRLRRDRSGAKDGPDAQTAPTQTGSVSRTARSAPIDTRSILVMCTVPLPVGRATPKLPSIRRAGRARAPATAANVSLCFRRSRCPVHAGGPTASAHTLDDVLRSASHLGTVEKHHLVTTSMRAHVHAGTPTTLPSLWVSCAWRGRRSFRVALEC